MCLEFFLSFIWKILFMSHSSVQNNPQIDPFANIFGIVRLAIDKIRELENRGQIYGFSKYLPNSVIVMKTTDFPFLVDVYIPNFTFYFQFSIIKDEKTKQIYVDDFRVVYPEPVAKTVNGLNDLINNESVDENE